MGGAEGLPFIPIQSVFSVEVLVAMSSLFIQFPAKVGVAQIYSNKSGIRRQISVWPEIVLSLD